MFAGIFDIKNDRRLSVYLYRMGFGMWLLYLIIGAPALRAYRHYRTDVGILCILLMVIGFSASMVYEYFHNYEVYQQKKKWLIISYLFLASVIYFIELRTHTFNWDWASLVYWLP
jgi:surface polysaccharide O-acyltransferase-like enzyme